MTPDAEAAIIAYAQAHPTCRAELTVHADPTIAKGQAGLLVCNLGPGHDGLHRDPVDAVWWTRDPLAAEGAA